MLIKSLTCTKACRCTCSVVYHFSVKSKAILFIYIVYCLSLILCFLFLFSVYRCSLPLGLENGDVPDAAFSASSSANSKHGPARSRLNIQSNSKGYGAWSAGANNGKQWLQIDFGELVRVTKVATQGRQDSGQWVTKYTLSYSVDGMHWAEYKEKSVTWVS